MSNNSSQSSPRQQHERTRLDADERRLMLVEAAYHLIAEKGLLALRIREVAERVGVNHATVVYHFPTKEHLIAAVIDYVGKLFLLTQAPGVPDQTTASPPVRLHTYFVNLLYQLRTFPQPFLVIDELFLQAQRDPTIQRLLHAEEEWASYLTALLEDGKQQGYFSPSIPMRTIVQIIMTFCKGLPLQQTTQAEDLENTVSQFELWVTQTLTSHHDGIS